MASVALLRGAAAASAASSSRRFGAAVSCSVVGRIGGGGGGGGAEVGRHQQQQSLQQQRQRQRGLMTRATAASLLPSSVGPLRRSVLPPGSARDLSSSSRRAVVGDKSKSKSKSGAGAPPASEVSPADAVAERDAFFDDPIPSSSDYDPSSSSSYYDGSDGGPPSSASFASYREDFSSMTDEELDDPSSIPGWRLITTPPRRYPKGALVGTVVSDKMQKTVNVSVDRYRLVPKYRKRVRYTRKFMAHDEGEACALGDVVMIVPCQRISKNKHFMVGEIIRPKGVL